MDWSGPPETPAVAIKFNFPIANLNVAITPHLKKKLVDFYLYFMKLEKKLNKINIKYMKKYVIKTKFN